VSAAVELFGDFVFAIRLRPNTARPAAGKMGWASVVEHLTRDQPEDTG